MAISKIRQIIAAVSSGMLLTGVMCIWGYPAAAMSQMEKPGSGVNFTQEQASWFTTVTLVTCIFGAPIGAKACEAMGPRFVMLILSPILCLFTMIMSAASSQFFQDRKAVETFLLVSRLGQALITALLAPLPQVYIYETSDKDLRNITTSLVEFWATLGFLLSYIAGCFFSWDTIAWLLPLVTLVPSFIGILASPESPLWEERKGRKHEAASAPPLLHSTEEEKLTEKKLASSPTTKWLDSAREVAKISNVKPIAACCLLLIMKEIGGFVALTLYVVYIFEQAGVGWDPQWSSVAVGVTRILCNLIATVLWDKLSHRLILFVGNILIAIATFVLGLFFYAQETGYDVANIFWVPLAGLVLHMIGAAGSIGPGTWAMAVEILPGSIRSIGFGLANTSYALTAFCVSKMLIYIQKSVGLKVVFWLFSGGSLGYIVLVALVIPETKGRSMKDIENYWRNERNIEEDDKV